MVGKGRWRRKPRRGEACRLRRRKAAVAGRPMISQAGLLEVERQAGVDRLRARGVVEARQCSIGQFEVVDRLLPCRPWW